MKLGKITLSVLRFKEMRMLNQFRNMAVNAFVKLLNEKGVNVSAETLNQAIDNSPHVIKEAQEILMSDSKDKIPRVIALIENTAYGQNAETQISDTPHKNSKE